MSSFSSLERNSIIDKFTREAFDLLVIGGGITGCGIALDAASRGLKVGLVEMNDFASGTSSKSTKLIHGGLRYLKQFEIALVREVGRERAIVHKLAPHLVASEKMLLPIIKNGTFGKMLTSIGLMVYDILAGVEWAEQRKMLTKQETLEAEPLLPEEILEGGGLYAEYRTDDARLTIEIIKTAVDQGATAINYTKAKDFLYKDGMVCGVLCEDTTNGKQFEIKSKYVVSAAGPWVDEVRSVNNSLGGKHLYLTKGVHIVLPHHVFPIKQAVYFDVPDGRMIFAIPRGRTTYIGTTDTPYNGDKDHVKASPEDVEYLLNGTMHIFSHIKLQPEDVISTWAGLRPLIFEEGKSASEISRKDEIFESESGLISIAGGKLTGYRRMAQKVVDLVIQKFKGRQFKKCHTDKIVLKGGVFTNQSEVKDYIRSLEKRVDVLDLDLYAATYLVSNYGRQSEHILELMHQFEDEDPRIRLARAELRFGVENELVRMPLDFFNRRTGRLYFEIDTIPRLIDPLLNDFKGYFELTDEQLEVFKAELDHAIKEAKVFLI